MCWPKNQKTLFFFAQFFFFLWLWSISWGSKLKSFNIQYPRPTTIYRSLYLGFFAIVYCFSAFFAFFLMVFHCYLVFSQQTTIEFLTNKYKSVRNSPNQRCYYLNFRELICWDRGKNSYQSGIFEENRWIDWYFLLLIRTFTIY